MDFEVKNQKNREKTVPKTMFFSTFFFPSILGGFGRDFGEVLGGVLGLLAPLGRRKIDIKNEGKKREITKCGLGAKSVQDPPPKVLLAAPGLDFGLVLKGLNRVLVQAGIDIRYRSV